MNSLPSFRKLRISNPARADLRQIGIYTGREWGAVQKKKYLGQIKCKFQALQQRPGLGILRDDIGKSLRSCPVGKHIIFYRETKTWLEIIRVLHVSMDVESLPVSE